MTSPLAGAFSVEASARVIRHYRYAEERMMRIMGGWIALTAELPAKLVFGRHVWDCAQHADLWGRRLPELRAPAQKSEPPNDAFVRFMDLLESPEDRAETTERLVGVYRVLKAHLVATYEWHLARANPVYEPPTRRILERLIPEERRHVAAGNTVLARVGDAARAEAWTRRLADALGEAGGVTGDGSVPPLVEIDVAGVDPSRDLVALDSGFGPDQVEGDLRARVEAHGRALLAGDVAGIEADVAPHARDEVLGAYARLPRGATAAEGGVGTADIVGVARLGGYRLVKLRLTGARESAIVQARWQPDGGSWQVVAADVVAVERHG